MSQTEGHTWGDATNAYFTFTNIFDNLRVVDRLWVNGKYFHGYTDSLLFENICSFGRPLWGSLCKTKLSDKKYDQIGLRQLTSLVMKKLVGDASKTLDQLTDNDALAILSCRLGAIRPLLNSTAQNLISKNMANIHLSRFWQMQPHFIFNKMKTFDNKTQSGLYFFVNKLVQAVQNSIVDQGEKGETTTKIMLLNAYDKCVIGLEIEDPLSSATRYCSYVKVESFMANLYRQASLDIIKQQLDHEQSEKLLNGY
ncbi:hypothetical protein BpHYR1_018207 [Brachionus plicatilis]|uniref:Uncharacterized protein n=1 Tax=Brachionus plicatilis TaxID=10195 RepID=A0A3M7S317_BRAPC|nr:hypothetical protein BpHYR1_018207 [Brachionus plicatilis]